MSARKHPHVKVHIAGNTFEWTYDGRAGEPNTVQGLLCDALERYLSTLVHKGHPYGEQLRHMRELCRQL